MESFVINSNDYNELVIIELKLWEKLFVFSMNYFSILFESISNLPVE